MSCLARKTGLRDRFVARGPKSRQAWKTRGARGPTAGVQSATMISARAAILGCLLLAATPWVSAWGATAPKSYRVEVSAPGQDPTELHVEEAGHGPPVLLLHGLGGSTFAWRHIVPGLARTHTVYAIDLKGFGRSDKPLDDRYSAADQAALITAFLRQRDLRGVSLVGHSFGGTVALNTALALKNERGRIAKLVVLDAPALQQDFSGEEELFRAPGLPNSVLMVTPPKLLAQLLLTVVSAPGREIPDGDVEGYAEPFRDEGTRHAFVATARAIFDANKPHMGKSYRAIRQPTLLIWCRRDRVVPLATGRRLAKQIPNARLQILNQCNHLPQDEVPDVLLSKLKAFLNH